MKQTKYTKGEALACGAMDAVSALLMAGGASRRMGRDKATLVVGGEPLWRRQVSTLREVGFAEIMIARGVLEPLGTGAPGLIEVPDAVPGCGPMGGLAAGLQCTSARWLLVLAVDLPLMPALFLREMIALAEADLRGVVPVIEGRREPLAAIYLTARAATAAREALSSHVYSLQPLVDQLLRSRDMRELEVLAEDRAFFRNVNTPSDLADLERQLAAQP